MARITPEERWERKVGPVHGLFGLSYASYLVIPRLALQEQSLDWQKRFAALMDEIDVATPDNYDVRRRGDKGKLISDPWKDYRHSTVEDAQRADALLKDN